MKTARALLVAVIAMGVCATAIGATISSSGYVGCRTKADFDSFVASLVQKDNGSVNTLLVSGRCISLSAGKRITVVNYSMFGASEILYEGNRMFTVREAINMKD